MGPFVQGLYMYHCVGKRRGECIIGVIKESIWRRVSVENKNGGNRSSQEQKRSTNNNKRGAIVIFGRLKCARGRGWFWWTDCLIQIERERVLFNPIAILLLQKPHTYIEPRRCFRLVIIIVIFLKRLYSLLFGIPYWETWMWRGHKCVQPTCPVTNFLLKKRRRNSEIRFAQFWENFYSWSFLSMSFVILSLINVFIKRVRIFVTSAWITKRIT
jgi:hypothetical protein